MIYDKFLFTLTKILKKDKIKTYRKVSQTKKKEVHKPVVAFLAGELLLPGIDSCFLIAGGVELNLLNGLTG